MLVVSGLLCFWALVLVLLGWLGGLLFASLSGWRGLQFYVVGFWFWVGFDVDGFSRLCCWLGFG